MNLMQYIGWRRNELLLLWKGVDHREEHEREGMTPLEDLSVSGKGLELDGSSSISINGDHIAQEVQEDLTL